MCADGLTQSSHNSHLEVFLLVFYSIYLFRQFPAARTAMISRTKGERNAHFFISLFPRCAYATTIIRAANNSIPAVNIDERSHSWTVVSCTVCRIPLSSSFVDTFALQVMIPAVQGRICNSRNKRIFKTLLYSRVARLIRPDHSA